jgi:hypothetical protein
LGGLKLVVMMGFNAILYVFIVIQWDFVWFHCDSMGFNGILYDFI